MKSRFINVLMFAAGAAIGSAVTWKIVKTQYDRIVQEELDSIKEAFNGNESDASEEQEENATDNSDEDRRGRTKQINWAELEDLDEEDDEEYEPNEADQNEYERLANNYTGEKGGSETVAKQPYVISPYDFGELDDYHQIELTYYADGTLEDEEGNIITDTEELIGRDSLYTFGEYEDDSVFVRNERLCTDFQILKDYRTYEQARSIGPKQVGDE